MNKPLFPVFLALCLAPAVAFTEISRFDADRDGMLSAQEFGNYYRQSDAPSILSFDLDADGHLSRDELEALAAEVERLFRVAQGNAEELTRKKSGESLIERLGVLIRESHASVNMNTQEPRLAQEPGANFSMTQDIASDSRVISVKGALLRPFRLGGDSRHWLLPGVEFNRLTNETEPQREVDSLTFRIGSDFNFNTERFGGGGVSLRVNPLLTTNFGFDVDVRALEVQLEPFWGAGGLGAERAVGPVALRTRLLFQGEYGEVYDAGQRIDLREGDSFARAGAKLGLMIWPDGVEPLEGLAGALNYEWHQDLGGDLRARRLFAASLYYQLDSLGHITLESRYVKGDTSVALEDEETWMIGLGVRL